ncbi:MAG: hypothetical protein ACR2QM_10700 [Longimicrobiales bacterium]
MPDRPVYTERTWFPAWVWVVMWGACLLAIGGMGYGALDEHRPGVLAEDRPVAWLLGGASILVLVVPALVTCFLGRLDVQVFPDRVVVAFGPARWIRTSAAYDEIESVEAVTYRPIRDFGGWGIRMRPGRTAWTVGGNRAVKLSLARGKELYLGSNYAQRLAERIKVAKQRHQRDL